MAAFDRALIVGGGISGLTLAAALARRGVATEIAEVTADGNVLGIGLALGAPALRALNTIGLLEQCLARGFPYARRTFCNLAGEPLSTQELPRLLGPAYPAQLGIPRPALHRLLLDACCERGAVVHFGLTVKALEQRRDGVEAALSDGERRTYDVVIGADGLYSQVRTLLFGDDRRPSFAGLAAWRIRTPRPPEADGIVVYRRGRHWVGFNPVTDTEGYIFMVEAVPGRVYVSQDALLPRLPGLLSGYGGLVAQLLPRVTNPADVLYRPIEVMMMPPPWHQGATILIGDAAHAPAPSLGAGALIAIEDAVVLAEELIRSNDVSSAFANFMTRRYDRCKLIVDTSIEIAEWQKNPSDSRTDPESLHARVGAALVKPI